MEDIIQVNSGAKRISIKNEVGDEVGVFYFNPTDVGIVDRFKDVGDKLDKALTPLERITEEMSEDEQSECFKEAKENLYEVCDYVFGGNMSGAFFGSVDPYSPVHGHFYFENALNAVSEYVGKQFGKETKKVNERVEKYTHGYRTGKHKGGRK